MSGTTKRTVVVVLLLAVVLSATAPEAWAKGPKYLSKIAGWQGASPKSAKGFSFVVVSDRTGGHVEGEWAAAVKQVNLLQPDFVICVGDLIEGYTEDKGTLLQQWEEFEAMTNEFDAPFFYCPGNHDVSNEVMWKLYSRRYGTNGKSYYSFDYRECHFVVLDSNTAMRSESFAQEQFAWLAKDLKRAKNAKHIFVFYHHPRWSKTHATKSDDKASNLWRHFRELLPIEKTTIFNGHYHSLSFELTGGIPEYVLSATGAGVGEAGFRMFAQVTVDRGEPTVALVPLHQILPPSYAAFAINIRAITPLVDLLIPAGGGAFTFKQQNQLSVPMMIDLQWQADGWTIEPEVSKFAVEPGASVEKRFSLTPLLAGPDKPTISATYTLTDPYRKRQLKIKRENVLGIYTQMDIPYVTDISIDADLTDWSAVKAMRIAGEAYVFSGKDNWSGQEDSSFDMRVASDGKRLFLTIDVTDDQIRIDSKQAWRNDGIEFFWDVRPPAKRNGLHGQGTGQVILVVPEQNEQIKPEWHMGQRAIPGSLKAIGKRRDGGYVFELSIAISDLGGTTAPIAGQTIWLAAMVNDRDRDAGKTTLTHTTTTGLGNNQVSTAAYPPWTFARKPF